MNSVSFAKFRSVNSNLKHLHCFHFVKIRKNFIHLLKTYVSILPDTLLECNVRDSNSLWCPGCNICFMQPPLLYGFIITLLYGLALMCILLRTLLPRTLCSAYFAYWTAHKKWKIGRNMAWPGIMLNDDKSKEDNLCVVGCYNRPPNDEYQLVKLANTSDESQPSKTQNGLIFIGNDDFIKSPFISLICFNMFRFKISVNSISCRIASSLVGKLCLYNGNWVSLHSSTTIQCDDLAGITFT